ncbi:MAG: pyridoxamine 5'-phosphate oxidase [Bacteroidetes bacterium]|nr:MAG: pyridoxamine 5'-phosphate oxidase [Bacteroidota bacterium]
MANLSNEQLTALRVDYSLKTFDETVVLNDPFEQFAIWFEEALAAGILEPNAMTLATIKLDLTPSARIVLLKGAAKEGFSFFTNYESDKGTQLAAHPHAALVFNWLELQRQVRIEGSVERLPAEDNDAYFYSRPLGSQIGAIASPQSRVIAHRDDLEAAFKSAQNQLTIKRPENWGGYLVKPKRIEFWQGRSNRLHDRFVFIKDENTWIKNRLAP